MNSNPYESPLEDKDSVPKSGPGKWIPHVLLWLGGGLVSLICGGPVGLFVIVFGLINEAERVKEKAREQAAIHQCPQCDRELANTSRICPRCGHRFPEQRTSEIEVLDFFRSRRDPSN